MCGEGFYGDLSGCRPDQIGVSSNDSSSCVCRRCECNGNVDANAVGNCDAKTGACMKCVFGTAGRRCERCLPGYFGVAVSGGGGGVGRANCTRCDCDPRGTLPDSAGECGPDGQCACVDHVGGRRCDVPEPGYRWWRKTDVDDREGAGNLVDPDDRLPPLPFIPGVDDGRGIVPLPTGGFRVIDPVTGRVIVVPPGTGRLVTIPPGGGGGGFRIIDPTSGREIPIPASGGSWVVDPVTGRVIGVPLGRDDDDDEGGREASVCIGA